jgi:hypothetical protein
MIRSFGLANCASRSFLCLWRAAQGRWLRRTARNARPGSLRAQERPQGASCQRRVARATGHSPHWRSSVRSQAHVSAWDLSRAGPEKSRPDRSRTNGKRASLRVISTRRSSLRAISRSHSSTSVSRRLSSCRPASSNSPSSWSRRAVSFRRSVYRSGNRGQRRASEAPSDDCLVLVGGSSSAGDCGATDDSASSPARFGLKPAKPANARGRRRDGGDRHKSDGRPPHGSQWWMRTSPSATRRSAARAPSRCCHRSQRHSRPAHAGSVHVQPGRAASQRGA